LEEQKIYVGYSQRPVGARFLEHFNRNGSKWTMLYKPCEVLLIKEGNKEDEDRLTLEMMAQYGWWNVRGGSYSQVDLKAFPSKLLQYQGYQLPKTLKKASVIQEHQPIPSPSKHIDSQTTMVEETDYFTDSDLEIDKIQCSNCSKWGHFEQECPRKRFKTFMKTELDVNWCKRCGKKGT
jgi:hypothetical protein